MSKAIKQMEMAALKQTFQGVRDLVVLSATGLNAQEDNQLRHGLRRKNVRLQVVKNSLVRRVIGELGIELTNCWEGPTLMAWGASSLSELSRELDAVAKKNNKVTVKLAVSEGQPVTFKQALAMPTKPEAIGRVLGLALSPASRLVRQLLAPAGQLAAQIKSLAEPTAAEVPASAAV